MDNGNFRYVYFIECHKNGIKLKLSIPETYSESKTLELIDQPKNEEPENNNSTNLYRFKIYPDIISEKFKTPEDFEIEINIEDENKNKCSTKIKNLDIEHDNYLYDFSMNSELVMDDQIQLYEINLNNLEKFKIFINYLRAHKLKQMSKENDELIYSTLNIINKEKEKSKKYDFAFLISLFMESFKSKYFSQIVEIINPKSIKEFGELQKNKITIIINILNSIEKKIFTHFEDKTNKEQLYFNFYTILFYVSFKFNKDKLNEMFKNENIKKYLYKTLLINEELFTGLILPKEQIIGIIDQYSDFLNFDQLSSKLKYNNDVLVLLQIIYEKKDLFLKYFTNKDSMIDIELLALPKKEDDMDAIYEFIKRIIIFEKNSKFFIKFSSTLMEKYINLFDNSDLDKLFSLSKIIDYLKKEEHKFIIKKNINEVIHQSGIFFSTHKKFNNIEILNFIENDHYYTNRNYHQTNYISIDILTGIDISLINDEFLKKWKKLDLFSIFENQKEIFISKVCSLVKDMKYFNVLFKLLNKNNEDDVKKEYDITSISKMQSTFEILMPTYSPEKCPNFSNELIDLIYYTDIYNVNSENFNKEYIQVLLNIDFVNNIYISLSKKYKDLSKNLINIIINFITKNPLNDNPLTLVDIIKKSNELRNNILSNMNNYVIKENDIYQNKDTSNFILLEGLIKEGIFKINEDYLKKTEYISESNKIMNNILHNIKNLKVNYLDMYNVIENKIEENLCKRVMIIIQVNKVEILKSLTLLKNYALEIKSAIEDLEDIFNDFNFFYKNKYKKEIIELNEIIRKIKYSTISSYLTLYEKTYTDLKNKFKNEVSSRSNLLKSIFFRALFKKNKSIITDEEKCLNKTKIIIKNLKNIFDQGILSSLKEFFQGNEIESNEKILETCLKPFKGNYIRDELNKELALLAKILNINDEYDPNKIIDNLLILHKKEEILNVSKSIKNIIKVTGAQKCQFYKMLKNIISNIYIKKDICTIKSSIDELEKEGDINFNEDKNKSFIEILKKLREQPEAVKCLLDTDIEYCRHLQELNFENDHEFLTSNDILDFEKCIEFMKRIGTKEAIKKMTGKELINNFRKLVEKYNKNNQIELLFNKYINNYGEIKELMNRGLDNSKIMRKKILLILGNSRINLTNNKEKFFTCYYYEKDPKDENKLLTREIVMKNLLELRDRSQLSKTITGDEKEKEIIKQNQVFIRIVSEINNIYEIIQEINKKGYPKEIIVEIKIVEGSPEFIFEDKKSNNYIVLISELKQLLNQIEEVQINAYKNKSLIRYIFGYHFNLIYNTIKNKNNKNDIFPLLQYFTNNLISKNVENFNSIETGDFLEDLMTNCENYLNEVLKINELSLEKIYKESLIEKKIGYMEYKGVYIYMCEKLEKELFQIYKQLTSNIPIAQNILLCNENTSNEEITSFLYRAMLCKFNACFIIGGVELLNSQQKSTLLEILKSIYVNYYGRMDSCLIILYTSKNTDIFRSLDSMKHRKILTLGKKEIEKQKYEGNDVEIIYSDKSGVGKTHKIKYDIFNNNNSYKHFPFGGVIEQTKIIGRLNKLKLDNYSEIHLDLYDTDQIQLMMEFLFSLLITKLFKYNEHIFYLSKTIKIKIEIPNSFIDFFSKFPILTLFLSKELTKDKLDPLIIEKDIKSNVQVVANYLKALKENRIDKEDLFFPSITPEFDSSKMKEMTKKYNYKCQEAQVIKDGCNILILEAMKNYIKLTNPTFYQIKAFINILGVQLKYFSKNKFLSAFNILSLNNKDLNSIRSCIIKNFINITKYFTQGAFDGLLKNQIVTHEILFSQYDEEKDIKNAIDYLAQNNNGIFSFEKIDSSLIFFHEGEKDDFSIITNKDQNDPEYKSLLKLYNYYKKKEDNNNLPNYKKYTQKEFLKELKEILNLDNPVETNEKNNKKSLESLTQNYVFTSDNFIKMIFILMRIRANVPVIMMGETGCGKTALISKLSELMNNGEDDNMKIFNIHAGTSDQDLIDFINTKIIPASQILNLKETEFKVNNYQKGKIYFEKKIWVFLDEINTCKSMGLISELMCKNSYQGILLPTNIIFIGACNPYRKAKITKDAIGLDVNLANREKENLNDKEKEKIKKNAMNSNKLVYTVNPLPHSLLNYIFDFGNLEKNDEEKYIENIIEKPFDNIYNKNKKEIKSSIFEKIKKLAKKMIIVSQNFIRDNNDVSSVSLREIRRFNIFFEFFYNFISFKKKHSKKLMETLNLEKEYTIYQSSSEIDIIIYSINLSIYICYYLRITNKDLRNSLCLKLNELLKLFEGESQEYKNFLYIPQLEQKFIIKNINLEKGISKNRALLENIFSLFVTINNKVPIFIVGKPGCSKSLSVQLITKAMKGSSSNNLFFKNLPKIIINSYQGSMGSTSKGVENVFAKARNIIKNMKDENDKKNNISMIFFDEMGLAENSPNNPLKVIHSELEYDLNEGDNKVAFVGISNWKLDASKMNRGIFISIPEPDELDLKQTSYAIAKSYQEILARKYKQFFNNLGKVYYDYKQFLIDKHNLDGKEDFHGNRDFYHLVKNCSKNILIKYNNNQDISQNDLVQFGIHSIERNFSGIQFDGVEKLTSVEKVKNYFNNIYPGIEIKKEYDIIKSVKDNINDLESRFLLLESKSSASNYLISSLLTELKKDYFFYIGSKFENDLLSEEYILKVLNKVQIYMEKGKIIILENLNSVYPAMYDLFNQNYTIVSNKKYARLAIGSSTNTYSLVNDNFRCIINENINEIDKEEAPFLNRFEKQIITFDYLLSEELIKESDKIFNIFKEMIKKNPDHKGLNYDLEKLLINCDIEEIRALIYDANKKGIKKENLIDEILSKISLTLPQDIILYLNWNGFNQKNNDVYNKIIDYYGKGEHTNLSRFIKSMKNEKNVVYTFSYDFDIINNIDNINNSIFGTINKSNIRNIILSSISSEEKLERYLDEFINTPNTKLCIIHFTPDEGSMMNYVKFIIKNKEKENLEYLNIQKNNFEYKKAFIFIMHVKRVFNNELKDLDNKDDKVRKEINKKILKETISNLSEYYQIFIDNLNGDDELILKNIIKMTGKDLFNKYLLLKEELNKNIYQTIFFMNYKFYSYVEELNNDTYLYRLIHYLDKNVPLAEKINSCIMKNIIFENDLITQILKKQNTITEKDIDLICIIKNYLSYLYSRTLNLFYFKAEKSHYISSLLSFEEIKNIIIKNKNDNLISYICPEFLEKNIKKFNNNEEKNRIVNNIIENIKDIYINNLNINDGLIRIKEKQESNNLNIIIGLNLPGLKPVLDVIIKNAKNNVCKGYYANENILRKSQNEGDELDKDKKKYYDELDKYNNLTLTDIKNNEYLNKIGKSYEDYPYELELFYCILLNDYYTLFIINNLYESKIGNLRQKSNQDEKDKSIELDQKGKEFDIKKVKEFLKLLIHLKNKYSNYENYSQIQLLANTINWLESYELEITILLKIFSKFNYLIPNLIYSIKDNILRNNFKYEISDRNPEFTSIVNKIFFVALESLLYSIITNIDKYLVKSEDSFTRFQNICKEILQDAMQLNINLNLYSKNIYTLQEIVELIDAFNMNNEGTIENITKLINLFSLQTIYISNEKKKDLCQILKKIYNYILKKIGNARNFHKIIIKMLLSEFIKVYYKEYRLQILDIILEWDKFIINSTQIIKTILKNVILNDPCDDLFNNIQILTDKDNEFISKLNKKASNNIHSLEQILLNIFEQEIFYYFDSIMQINNKTILKKFPKYFNNGKEQRNQFGILLDESFKTFKNLVEFLEDIIDKNNNHKNLAKLYAISFIKIYIKYFVSFIKDKKANKNDISIINNFICDFPKNNKNNFRKVLKIYILKMFYSVMDNNLENFKNFHYEDYGINFHKGFSLWESKQKSGFCLMHIDNEKDKNNFFEFSEIFENYRINQFSMDETRLINNINKCGFDTFLCIAINKIISNLGDSHFDSKDLDNLFKFISNIFNSNKYKCKSNLKRLLFLFLNKEIFERQIKNKIKTKEGIISNKLLEILLYSFRLCVQSLDLINIHKNNNNLPQSESLFSNILDEKCNDHINQCYIPTNEYQDLHLTTLELVESHLMVNPDNIGCYVCSCGYYYSIQPCGFPTRGSTSQCPICKLKIGFGEKKVNQGYHGLVRRPGHYRIFKDEKQQKTCMKRYNDSDENVPNIILEKYKKDIIESIKKRAQKGLNPASKDMFLNIDKKIRNLNPLSFRILHYIIYSHIFFANCLDYISKNDLKKYLIEGMNCIQIIEKDWGFIENLLQQKGIKSIQIFMNLIFKRVSEIIKKYDYLADENYRNSFEDQFEGLINQSIKEYGKYSLQFIEEKKKILDLKDDSFQNTIQELSPPTEDKYPSNDYPLFNYFILTKYSSKDELLKKLGPPNIYGLKYPLLRQYLLYNQDAKKMKNLPVFNVFTNYMVDNYSFKISRDDAKKRILKFENIFNEKGFKNKFDNFIKAWNEIKSEAIKYKCRDDMKPKNLSSEDALIYFLNDDGELGNGMYLASACQNFIAWQNNFLQPIIESIAQNGILHYFSNNMKRKIPLQTAKKNQVLLIDDCFKNSLLYYNFEDLISTFCIRDIFSDDNKINYSNYNSFIYDFESIEEELGKLLLPGRCLFDNEENLNFITYWSEGFRSNKSSTLSDFYLKYPQKDLNDEEKKIIINYIKNQNNYNYRSFFGSIQLIIFYLTKNIFKKEEKIKDVITNSSRYLNLSIDCITFFEKEGNIFKIEQLMNIFFFIEHLVFKDLIETLNVEYKKPIPKDLTIKIKQKLLGPENKNEGFTVSQLSAAVRRYISRYIAGNRQTIDIDEKLDLTVQLERKDLWEEKIGKLENLDNILKSKIGEFKLTVGQAYEFYKIIESQDLKPFIENNNLIGNNKIEIK